MLASLGDLIEDIVVMLGGTIQLASDTESSIVRRRGGSAANVASTAARLGRPSRFLGQVGDDAIGTALISELSRNGVDTSLVRRGGSTGTIVVLVDEAGERSMLTDRKSCVSLDDPDPSWLDGVDTLHVPLYGLAGGQLAETAQTLIGWAHERHLAVSVDASSAALLERLGVDTVRSMLGRLRPDVLLANGDEARVLDLRAQPLAPVTVIKRGPEPALLMRATATQVEVPAEPIEGVDDTTAAGDAFAAGFLTSNWRENSVGACRAGHAAAAALLRAR